MKIKCTFLALSILFVFSACHRYYTTSSFAEKSARHKKIAVLPPQVIFTGNQPRGFSAYDMEVMEEKESRVFQQSLYNNILKRSDRGKHMLTVSVQPYANTLALLEKNEVSIRQAWTKSDQELASILGVDAIVRSTIQKDRFMSDFASAGIDAGRRILDAVIKNPVSISGTNKTSDITATCSIVSNGETLWNDSYKRGSNYSIPANEVIENITANFAKHFPYRKKA